MRRTARLLPAVGALLVGATAGGCAALAGADREAVVRRILPAMVQIRVERPGGGRAAGSGVVVASDPAGPRSWVVSTRHLLGRAPVLPLQAVAYGRPGRLGVRVVATSEALDLALLEVPGVELPVVQLQDEVGLGDPVWVAGFPWGRRLTLVAGVVSQLASDDGGRLVGPAAMVDASVSYGVSGGGVFDAATGRLVGVVEGYRTARVVPPSAADGGFDIPVPGETTIIDAGAIRRFLGESGLAGLLAGR